MQVPTSAFYDRSASAMNALSTRADTLQTQISTGKRLSAPSQDTAAYQRLAGIKRANANDDAYAGNLELASSVLSSADATLSSITDRLQRASELALAARTGTQNDASRQSIADEIDEIVASLVTLGNTKDSRGQALFGGADGGAAVSQAADGSYSFAARPIGAIPIGDDASVQPTETAARVFQAGGTDIISALAAFSAALKTHGDVAAASDTAIARIGDSSNQVATVQASLGARAARVEVEQNQLSALGTDREAVRSSLEDTDVTAAITDLQKTMTILSATQASFTKLANLTLFDYLK